jgi:UDP-N-acetylmuramate: L-alanyl-gamma-D-glutamyl-meso-diaminopimelate ligase
VANAFESNNITVFTDSKKMVDAIKAVDFKNSVLLMMSSGNFDGIDFNAFAKELGM